MIMGRGTMSPKQEQSRGRQITNRRQKTNLSHPQDPLIVNLNMASSRAIHKQVPSGHSSLPANTLRNHVETPRVQCIVSSQKSIKQSPEKKRNPRWDVPLENNKEKLIPLSRAPHELQSSLQVKITAGARSQRIKSGFPLEICTNNICSAIDKGKTSFSLPLSQNVPCQKNETGTEKAVVGL